MAKNTYHTQRCKYQTTTFRSVSKKKLAHNNAQKERHIHFSFDVLSFNNPKADLVCLHERHINLCFVNGF